MSHRVWLVTGASSGFGAAMAAELVRRGQRVVVTARDTGRLEALVASAPERVKAIALDVTRPAAIGLALDEARAAFGTIDVLVNNAGAGHVGYVEDLSLDVFRGQIELNLLGPIALIKGLLPAMRARRSGQIVNIASLAGLVGFPLCGAYSAAKFGIVGLSEALAGEVAGLGIKVTVVELGPFATGFASVLAYAPPASADYAENPPPYVIGNEGWDAGDDPVRGARLLIDALEAEAPPLHLQLGSETVRVAKMYEERRAEERARWMRTSLLESGQEA